VPTAYGKSDIQLYRDAGEEVAAVLGRRADAFEKASVDEAYIDITTAAMELLDKSPLRSVLEAAAGTHVAGSPSRSATEATTATSAAAQQGVAITNGDGVGASKHCALDSSFSLSALPLKI
jgi:nucleotidyltransferase/DNA polymerase involved in DNA repair